MAIVAHAKQNKIKAFRRVIKISVQNFLYCFSEKLAQYQFALYAPALQEYQYDRSTNHKPLLHYCDHR